MDDRISVSVEQVKGLIADQFPELRNLTLSPITPGGWNNRSFRLGQDLVVRLPAAERYQAQVGRERLGMQKLPSGLPVDTPRFFAKGKPGQGYPYEWSILHWVEGTALDAEAQIVDPGLADEIGQFLSALHQAKPPANLAADVDNFYRGGALSHYDGETRRALQHVPQAKRVLFTQLWEQALSSAWQSAPVWVHGDIAPGNLLAKDGHLCGVIDFSMVAAGDPASDLAIAWTHMDVTCRERFVSTLSLDQECWQRARGWALWKAAIVLAGEAAPAAHVAVSKRVLDTLISDVRIGNTKG